MVYLNPPGLSRFEPMRSFWLTLLLVPSLVASSFIAFSQQSQFSGSVVDRSDVVYFGVWMNFIPSPKTDLASGGVILLSVRSWKVKLLI